MTKTERAQFWQHNLAEWVASGLSGNAFCKQQSLTYHQFVYWRKRLSESVAHAPAASRGCGFARVMPVTQAADTDGLTLTLPGGMSIRGLHAGNIDLLGAILRQL